MPAWGEALVAVTCIVGIVGSVLPVLPGSLLIGGSILVWAVVEGSVLSWAAAAVAIALLIGGHALTYLVPGARMTAAGIPRRSLVAGALLGLVGMVVVPVVGLPLGFVLGVYLAELTRLRTHRAAWPSTVEAMRGVGLSVLIGLCAAVAATGVWLAVAVTT